MSDSKDPHSLAYLAKLIDKLYNGMKVPRSYLYGGKPHSSGILAGLCAGTQTGRIQTRMPNPPCFPSTNGPSKIPTQHPAKIKTFTSFRVTRTPGKSTSVPASALRQQRSHVKQQLFGALYGSPNISMGTRAHGLIDEVRTPPSGPPTQPPPGSLPGYEVACGHCPLSLQCLRGKYPKVCQRCRRACRDLDNFDISVLNTEMYMSNDALTMHVHDSITLNIDFTTRIHQMTKLRGEHVPTACPLFRYSEMDCGVCNDRPRPTRILFDDPRRKRTTKMRLRGVITAPRAYTTMKEFVSQRHMRKNERRQRQRAQQQKNRRPQRGVAKR